MLLSALYGLQRLIFPQKIRTVLKDELRRRAQGSTFYYPRHFRLHHFGLKYLHLPKTSRETEKAAKQQIPGVGDLLDTVNSNTSIQVAGD